MESEQVRLVIWDLDETLWRGTLSEGGISEYIAQNHEMVVELARRVILSSICSKNDYDAVEQELTKRGLWDYFVFPSIDWTPKGSRIRHIVDAAQLRPSTCLFIDDNPNNLAEAKAAVPDLQTASERLIPFILDDFRFKGKRDPGLTRLSQYKLLERRQKAAGVAVSQGRNEEFLHSCQIKISFEYDVEPHIDRAIELINRTNQLNFTKLRLPESNAAAVLRAGLERDDISAALIRVTDIYGDYGYTGFYVLQGVDSSPILKHFCFSCRTLGMGVENFVYKNLGAPQLTYHGEVLSDPINDAPVNWIAVSEDTSPGASDLGYGGGVYLIGGCGNHAMSHYLRRLSGSAVAQTNLARGSLFYRHDGSAFLAQKLSGLTETEEEALLRLGFHPEDLAVPWNADTRDKSVVVLNFYGDVVAPFYRHKEMGLLASLASPLVKTKLSDWGDDEWRALSEVADRDLLRSRIDEMQTSWEFHSWGLPEHAIETTITGLLDRFPPHWRIFMVMPSLTGNMNGSFCDLPRAKTYRQACEAATRNYSNVSCVHIEDFVRTPNEIEDAWAAHFNRMVYYRLSNHILHQVLNAESETRAVSASRSPVDCA
jgi:FkbH-like protein